MAVATKTQNQSCGNLACGHTNAQCPATLNIDTFTSAGLQSNGKIKYTATCSGVWNFPNGIVWASSAAFSCSMSIGGQSTSFTIGKGCNTACPSGQGSCCNCNGISYSTGSKSFTFELSPSTTSVTLTWTYNGNTTSLSYTIPASMRITNPEGLSVSFPYSLSGSTVSSVTSWGGGTPGTYTLQLISSSGYSLGSTSTSTSSTSNTYQYTPGSWSSNSRYYLKLTACNSASMCDSKTSSWYYTAPPKPSVYINSLLYNPTTQDVTCNWSWSKPSDGGYYTETITYDVYDNEGNYYVTGGSLGTATSGAAKSGTKTTTGILTAVNLCVKVYVSTSAGTSSATACAYAPVAGAAFLGFEWDELRRECTVRATAPGARQTRVSGGYAPNNYNIGSKVTLGEFGDLIVKDLKHGNGEILYLEAMPESRDNHQYIDEVAKISIPIPNPILGIKKYPCGSDKEDEYIVDIIEHKANGTCTPRWNVGDRVVRTEPCFGGGVVSPCSSGTRWWGNADGSISYDYATGGNANNGFLFAQASLLANGTLNKGCIQLDRKGFLDIPHKQNFHIRLVPLDGVEVPSAVQLNLSTNGSSSHFVQLDISSKWTTVPFYPTEDGFVLRVYGGGLQGRSGSFRVEFYVD